LGADGLLATAAPTQASTIQFWTTGTLETVQPVVERLWQSSPSASPEKAQPISIQFADI
jgi:hypothetical protein